jgi:hypothetical protein
MFRERAWEYRENAVTWRRKSNDRNRLFLSNFVKRFLLRSEIGWHFLWGWRSGVPIYLCIDRYIGSKEASD